MKTNSIKIAMLFFLLAGRAVSQSQEVIQTFALEITANKTSSIIFPTVIKGVDRGSRDILAQKAKGVDNVLQLKAGKENFPETNLTVITGDGTVHHFSVTYAAQPSNLIMDMGKNSGLTNATPLIFQTEMTETDMENYSTSIIQTKRRIRFIKEKKHKINLALVGIYIKEDIIFYRLRIKNQSNINYDIDFLKFYICDNAKIKRTASQQIEVVPLYVHGNNNVVKGKSETDIVYVLEKFTIPESKHAYVELFERNGGRHFNLIIKNKTIVNAQLLQ